MLKWFVDDALRYVYMTSTTPRALPNVLTLMNSSLILYYFKMTFSKKQNRQNTRLSDEPIILYDARDVALFPSNGIRQHFIGISSR
jgi:hypothetical protein